MHGAVERLGAAISDGVASVTPMSLSAEQLPEAWPGTWNPLGVTLDEHGANVAVWSEGAHAVDLCLFDEDGRESRIALSETTFHTFHGYVPGMKAGDRYGFRVHGPWDPWRGDRWNSAKLLMDPYARAIEGEYVPHPATRGHVGHDDTVRDDRDSAPYVPRSVVVADDGFDWRGDARLNTPWTQTVIYEAHVTGLTMRHPGVPEHLRGTYAGLAHPASIEHLTRLGVTAVELLPVHHFITEDHVLAPRPDQLLGLQHPRLLRTARRVQLVGHPRPAGHGVQGDGPGAARRRHRGHPRRRLQPHGRGQRARADAELPGHRQRRLLPACSHGRHYADYTGCGNTLDASQPHVLQLIMDSLRYWVTEMHVDGFRFDLASALARSFHDVDMLGIVHVDRSSRTRCCARSS